MAVLMIVCGTILGVAACVVLVVLQLVHRHKWINVDVNPRPYAHKTVVLRRCRCGDTDTMNIEGEWTREALGVDQHAIAELYRLMNDVA